MKGSPAAYQHQRLRNHTTPGNQSSVSPSGLILALCPVYAILEWEEVRYSKALRKLNTYRVGGACFPLLCLAKRGRWRRWTPQRFL